jgi:hypothetical protein
MRQFAVAALAVLTAGCLPVTVYQQANPNPLRGHHTFVLRPLDTTTLLIDGIQSEVEWLVLEPLGLGEDYSGLGPRVR